MRRVGTFVCIHCGARVSSLMWNKHEEFHKALIAAAEAEEARFATPSAGHAPESQEPFRRESFRVDGMRTRNDTLWWGPAEVAIAEAMNAVEAAGASEALTRAVTLLAEARERVADHYEGIAYPPEQVEADTREVHAPGRNAAKERKESRDLASGVGPGPEPTTSLDDVGSPLVVEDKPGISGHSGVDVTPEPHEVEDVIADALFYMDPNEKLVLRWAEERSVVTPREANVTATEVRLALEAKGMLATPSAPADATYEYALRELTDEMEGWDATDPKWEAQRILNRIGWMSRPGATDERLAHANRVIQDRDEWNELLSVRLDTATHFLNTYICDLHDHGCKCEVCTFLSATSLGES